MSVRPATRSLPSSSTRPTRGRSVSRPVLPTLGRSVPLHSTPAHPSPRSLPPRYAPLTVRRSPLTSHALTPFTPFTPHSRRASGHFASRDGEEWAQAGRFTRFPPFSPHPTPRSLRSLPPACTGSLRLSFRRPPRQSRRFATRRFPVTPRVPTRLSFTPRYARPPAVSPLPFPRSSRPFVCLSRAVEPSAARLATLTSRDERRGM